MSLFLMWGEGRGLSGGQAKGVACVCVCVCVCVCSGHAQYPVLLPTHSFYTPGSSKLAAGVCGLFLFFGSSICSN